MMIGNKRLKYLAVSFFLALAMFFSLAVQAQEVRTLSTGVGKEGRVPNSDFSVLFTFAELQGPYLSDVRVTVYDEGGAKVVNESGSGPWLLADLSPGDYRVVAASASGEGQAAAFTVTGGNRQKVVRLVWR